MDIVLRCGLLEGYMRVPTMWMLLSITGIFFGNSHQNLGTSYQISSVFLSVKVDVIFPKEVELI